MADTEDEEAKGHGPQDVNSTRTRAWDPRMGQTIKCPLPGEVAWSP